MEKDWVLVHTMKKEYNAVVIKEVFNKHNIDCIMKDKKDASYTAELSGSIEAFVHKDNELKARQLIQEFEEGAGR